MRSIIDTIVMILLSYQACLLVGWWGLVPICFISGLFQSWSGSAKYWPGMLAGAVLWGAPAIYHILAGSSSFVHQTAEVLQLSSSWLLVLVTALIGTLIAGLSRKIGVVISSLYNSDGAHTAPSRS